MTPTQTILVDGEKAVELPRHGGCLDLLAMDHNNVSQTKVARYFGRDVITMSNGVRQLGERSNKEKQFRQQVTRVEECLVQITTSKA